MGYLLFIEHSDRCRQHDEKFYGPLAPPPSVWSPHVSPFGAHKETDLKTFSRNGPMSVF